MGDKVVIAIDEFQKVTDIDDQGWLEATLRTYMQQLRNTSFILRGQEEELSMTCLIIILDQFYRSCRTDRISFIWRGENLPIGSSPDF